MLDAREASRSKMVDKRKTCAYWLAADGVSMFLHKCPIVPNQTSSGNHSSDQSGLEHARSYPMAQDILGDSFHDVEVAMSRAKETATSYLTTE